MSTFLPGREILQVFYQLIDHAWFNYPISNHIGGVMVSMLAPDAADRGFEVRSGQQVGSNQSLCNWYLLLLQSFNE
jgi:hypothetical protein